MKRVLVTGANGFIGRSILPMLCESAYEVHAVSRTNSPVTSENIQWHQADLLDDKAVEILVKKVKPTFLLHFAWITKHGEYWESPANLDWLVASINLTRCFIENGGKRVVVSGSCAEYDWDYSRLDERSTPCKPTTLYGVSKYSLYMVLKNVCQSMNVSFAWGRIFLLYGEGEAESRFVPMLINGMLDRERVECSDGAILRDFLHVKDVAAAFVALLGSDISGAINIASGKPVSLGRIAQLVEAEFEYEGDIVFTGLAKNQPVELVAEVRRLTQELNWEPDHSLELGIRQVVSWWRDHRGGTT